MHEIACYTMYSLFIERFWALENMMLLDNNYLEEVLHYLGEQRAPCRILSVARVLWNPAVFSLNSVLLTSSDTCIGTGINAGQKKRYLCKAYRFYKYL